MSVNKVIRSMLMYSEAHKKWCVSASCALNTFNVDLPPVNSSCNSVCSIVLTKNSICFKIKNILN